MVNELPPFITEAQVKSRTFLRNDEPDYVTEAKVKSYTYCNFQYYITDLTIYYITVISYIHYIYLI